MPSFKKSKSNDALSSIGSIRTGRLNGDRVDPDNFPISYRHVRWSLRAAQVVLAITALGIYSNQSHQLWYERGLYGSKMLMLVIAGISLLVSPFQAAMYISQFVGKWTSRRVLTIETSIDAFMTLFEAVVFVVLVSRPCPAGSSDACDRYNWATSWTFFLIIGWGSALATDCISWYRATTMHTRLDDQTEMAIRRARMGQH